jgi:hypothetical protein
MAFKPTDNTAASPVTDASSNTWQQHAHQYQVASLDGITSASSRDNAEKHLQPMHLDHPQGRADVEKQYGVEVKENNGKYEYHSQENGKDKVLFSTDATPKGLEEGSKKLDGLVQAKEKELEAKHPGIVFAKAGDDLGDQKALARDGNAVSTGEKVTARNPSLKELAGLEAALEHSDPSYKSADGQPLHVQFPDKPVFKSEDATGDYSSYSPPKDGAPATLNIDMSAGEHKAATEKDVTRRDSDRNSIESCITHELAHATQHNVDGLDKDAAYKNESGWVPLRQPAQGRNEYALKGKDGYLYQPIPGPHDTVDWVKMEGNAGYDKDGNYKGAYIGKDGKPIKDELKTPEDVLAKTDHISNNDMIKQAEVTPSTHYFKNPEEMMAEALTDYRMNATSREQLKQQSPQLYEAARHLDQLELDKVYGQGKKVRNDDGTVGDA